MKIGEEKKSLIRACSRLAPVRQCSYRAYSIAAYFHNEGMPLFYIQLYNKSGIVMSTPLSEIPFFCST